MKSTQDAISQGLAAGTREIVRFINLREAFIRKCHEMKDCGRWDLAIHFAAQAQFYREAIFAEQIVADNQALF